MTATKVKIHINGNYFEIEGSEDFVSRHLERFQELLSLAPASQDAGEVQSTKRRPKLKKRPKPAVTQGETGEDASPSGQSRQRSKAKSRKVAAERFDIHGGDGKPSLMEFLDEKKPGSANGPRIAAIGYYITEVLGQGSFTEGQIEYAYKMLNFKRPNHLHQIMINNKNQNDYYDQIDGTESSWQLTRSGEIFVGDNLPADD
ncbi:MAG: hypothetical protein ACO1PZ_01735 [Gammaproteobacteria bacterium]